MSLSLLSSVIYASHFNQISTSNLQLLKLPSYLFPIFITIIVRGSSEISLKQANNTSNHEVKSKFVMLFFKKFKIFIDMTSFLFS